MLQFALTALLGTPPAARVFLAAPADDVARVVYGIARALPPAWLDDVTFSTYESDPLPCPARLVGFDPGTEDGDLPAGCHAAGAAFNLATGQSTKLPAEVPYAAFAAAALANGEYGELDEVKATWQRLGLPRDARLLDLVDRMTRGSGVLTKAEAAEALRHPPLAAWLSSRPDALERFLEWAVQDREFATASFSWAVQALRQQSAVTVQLAQAVKDLGLAALEEGDRERAANALEVVLPLAAPARANAVWGEVLERLTDPGRLSWGIRGYLLPRLVRVRQQSTAGVDPALAAWLRVGADHLGELLALELPRAYQVAAGRDCLARPGEPSGVLVQTVASHPTLALALLQPDVPDGDTDKHVQFFEALMAHSPGRPWLEEVLERAGDYPPGLLGGFLEVALAAGKVDAERVVRTHGPRLLEVFGGQSGLDRVGTRLLADPPPDLLREPALLGFLGKLAAEPQVSGALKTQITAVQTIRAYLDAPAFTVEGMAPVAAALALHPPVVPASARGEVLGAVAEELGRRAKSADLQAHLEAVLVNFGSVLADDPPALFDALVRQLRGRADFGRQVNLLHGLLAVALGAAENPDLNRMLDGLDGHALSLASEAARRGGRRLLRELDRRSEGWPKPARRQWGFLLAAVRPRGLRGVLRDGGLVLAGASAATLCWWAAQFVSR
jgi:hypothetical protein